MFDLRLLPVREGDERFGMGIGPLTRGPLPEPN